MQAVVLNKVKFTLLGLHEIQNFPFLFYALDLTKNSILTMGLFHCLLKIQRLKFMSSTEAPEGVSVQNQKLNGCRL